MSKWREVRVKDIAYTNKHSMKNNYDGEIRYIDITSVGERKINNITTMNFSDAPSRAKRIVQKGDTIISTVRPNLKSFYHFFDLAKTNIVCSTGFAVLTAKKNINSAFLYYYLTQDSYIKYLVNIAKGSAYPAVSAKDIKESVLRIPDLPTQEKIAKILSTYDKLIENNNKRIELLEKASEELYKEWFVRMRFPEYKNTKIVNGIPEGWEVKNFINKHNKLLNSGIDYFEGIKKYIATSDVSYIHINNYTEMSYDKRPSRANMEPEENVIFFAKMKNTKKYILVDSFSINSLKDFIFSTGFAGIKCKDIYYYYYLSFIRFGSFEQIKDLYAIGATQEAINNTNLRKIKILIPDSKYLNLYNDKISRMYRKISILQNQNQNLIKQRDLLLPRLMSGKLEV